MEEAFVRKSTGPPVEGAVVKRSFDEAPETYDVIVRHVIKNERIAFEWLANEGGYNTRVEMAFKTLDNGATLVQISESAWLRVHPWFREARLDGHSLRDGLA